MFFVLFWLKVLKELCKDNSRFRVIYRSKYTLVKGVEYWSFTQSVLSVVETVFSCVFIKIAFVYSFNGVMTRDIVCVFAIN